MTATWHTPKTWELNELVTENMLNEQVRDNVSYLFERPLTVVTSDRGSNFVSTSTSFVNVHAGDMALTPTLVGTRARVTFQGNFRIQTSSPGAGRLYLDIAVDGIRQAGDDGLLVTHITSDDFVPLAFSWVLTGLTPGTHTVTLQWKAYASVGTPTVTLYAGAGTGGFDVHPQFSVEEF